MSYEIIDYSSLGAVGAKPRITAVLDSAADVEALGGTEKWSPGSLAILAEAGFPTLLLSKSNGWVNGNTGGSGGSGGSGLPSGSSPNQYLVTDGEGNAKWEDKPFGEETEVILPVQDIPKLGDAYGVAERCNLVAGETYTVTFEGVEYICVAKTFDMDGVATVILGNTYFLDSEAEDATEEPFVYMPVPDEAVETVGACGMVLERDGRLESVQFGIAKNTITKISGKYVEGMGWSEEGNVVLVMPFTDTYGEETPNRGSFPLTLEEGKSYTVKWDGVEYDCTCFVDELNRLVVGNASLMEAGANTNEPFLVGVQDGDSFVKAQTGGEMHTLSIVSIGEIIHPIDQKYLPSATYYVMWSDDKGSYILYKDKNCTEGTTIDDFDSVLSAKVFREGDEFLAFGGARFGAKGGFGLNLFIVNGDNSVVYRETLSSDFVAGGPM